MDSNIISTKKLREFSDQVRMAWYRLHGGVPVRVENQRYLCDAANLQFWDKVNSGRWEPKTFAVLDRLLTAETIYCDIGAWIGPTVLYAARNCRKVYCLEPDRVAYKHLLDNIQMNRLENVLPFNMALAEKDGLHRMASPRGKRGDSMTSLLLPQGTRGMDVLCLTWQNWFALVGKPSFNLIKMDIEGGEFSLLPAMRSYLEQYRPQLYLSLHPHLLPVEARKRNMATVTAALEVYGGCYNQAGEHIALDLLLTEPAVHRSGTYLLLPE